MVRNLFIAIFAFFTFTTAPAFANDIVVAMLDTSVVTTDFEETVMSTEPLEVTVRPIEDTFTPAARLRELNLAFNSEDKSVPDREIWKDDPLPINGKRWQKRVYDWRGATGYPTVASNMVSASGQVVRTAVRLNEYEKPWYIRNADATNDWTYAFGIYLILGKQYKDVTVGWN